MGIRKKAFSLIEISVAILMLSLICSGVLGVISQGISYLQRSRERTTAYNLAREVIERYFQWSSLPANGSYVNPAPYPLTINNITYNVNLNISDGPVAPAVLKQVEVTVSWGTQQYDLITLKSDY